MILIEMVYFLSVVSVSDPGNGTTTHSSQDATYMFLPLAFMEDEFWYTITDSDTTYLLQLICNQSCISLSLLTFKTTEHSEIPPINGNPFKLSETVMNDNLLYKDKHI